MNTPEISIIIPVYNGETTIKTAVESIVSLNHNRLELILIDDHSTDGSLNVCKSLAKKYNFVKVLSNKQNVGVAQSRQNGLNECTGELVTFCDQDDMVCSSYDSFIRAIQEKDADILVANYMISYKGNAHLSSEIENDTIVSGNENCKYLAKGVLFKGYKALNKPILANTIWNCIFRRSLIKRNNLKIKSYVSYEDDWLFLIDYLSVAKKAILSSDSFYMWIVSDNSQSKQDPYLKNYVIRSKRLISKVKKQAHNIIASRMELICFIIHCYKGSIYRILMNLLKH